MKRYLLLILAITTFISCNDDDDDYHDYHLEYTEVISADVPEEFEFGRTYRVEVTIELDDSCHFFYNQYDYFYEGTSRLIYPIVHIDDGIPCTPNIREVTFSIPVQALQTEPYIFKFYQGEDADGQDLFLTIEVPVV
ncbi:hypothetical protein [Urechidicola vernalis]|uniref:DUF4625 domain-containing protein n=1 Tax=Urechidicola vernalis TaxID=3075600 RepID=A0ABU2Y636_9FLAO|nr:hypothetical protein [Urechidicola sp. P050]MDT0553655.1 hypothetical protein [Urechidicola sp. P050]